MVHRSVFFWYYTFINFLQFFFTSPLQSSTNNKHRSHACNSGSGINSLDFKIPGVFMFLCCDIRQKSDIRLDTNPYLQLTEARLVLWIHLQHSRISGPNTLPAGCLVQHDIRLDNDFCTRYIPDISDIRVQGLRIELMEV